MTHAEIDITRGIYFNWYIPNIIFVSLLYLSSHQKRNIAISRFGCMKYVAQTRRIKLHYTLSPILNHPFWQVILYSLAGLESSLLTGDIIRFVTPNIRWWRAWRLVHSCLFPGGIDSALYYDKLNGDPCPGWGGGGGGYYQKKTEDWRFFGVVANTDMICGITPKLPGEMWTFIEFVSFMGVSGHFTAHYKLMFCVA